MNTELMLSEPEAGASWNHPLPAQAPGGVSAGRWDPSLGRLGIGERTRTRAVAAASYRALPDSVRSAREFGVESLFAWRMPELAENLRLIVSELVGNACRHAVSADGPERTRITLQLRPLPEQGTVVCMVADPSPKGPVRVDAHHFAESGRGLSLIAAFSREWGWGPALGHGKVVWAVCASDPL
ncbi:ATP-binding protein [Nocardiopsis terrae]